MSTSKVYLVGAGPGDPGLLTIKGRECIEKAQVIIYDRLVNPALLSYKSHKAELIYVGKSPKRHTLTQEEINQLIVKKALEGKVVTRLKGGDPFVFGRGGEEGQALKREGIPFEIVPGITSSIAVPAYAGIPVTHRGVAVSFTVITGHEDPDKEETQINWLRLAKDPGTLIFLMGVENLPMIVKQLLAGGKDRNTPVAVVRWGTYSRQQVVTGTIESIVKTVKETGITSPAIILVGDVVALRDELMWFEKKTFFAKRVVVTRCREQASELSKRIRELGGEAIEFPVISIEQPYSFEKLDNAIKKAGEYQWLIFTSVNGVKSFFNRMKDLGLDVRSLGQARLCAIGPATKRALEDKGLFVEFMPKDYYAESMLDGLKEKVKPGEKVLIPRADIARPLLINGLSEMGLMADEVIAYRTIAQTPDERLIDLVKKKEIDVVTFTSSSTVKNFINCLGDINLKEAMEGITIACIGPITRDTALEYGLHVDVVADEFTIDGLIDSLCDYFEKE